MYLSRIKQIGRLARKSLALAGSLPAFFLVGFAGANSRASELTSANITAPASSTGILRGEKKIDALAISVGQESYLNRNQPPAGVTDYTIMGVHLRAQADSRPLSGTLDLSGSFATAVENYNSFEVPEAYVSWNQDADGIQIAMGRKRELWSALDNEWMLGLTQPLNRFDGLRPTEQGLTGLFAGWKSGGFQAILFASNVFIPEQGAPYELQNGSFTTHSPWFSAPPDSLILSSPSKPTPVRYNLQIPSVGSVINHPSSGVILRVADPAGEGLYAQGSFARKPRNSLSLPFDANLVLTDNTSYGGVTVRPQVDYHSVASADLGYRSENFGANVSALTESPADPTTSPGYTYERLDPVAFIGAGVEGRFFTEHVWAPRMRVSYLTSSGGGSESFGPNSTNNESVFGYRTLFREALSFSVDSTLISSADWKLAQSVRWIEELREDGAIVMFDTHLALGRIWQIGLAVDVLGSRKALDDTSTFISRFRGNDRVAGKVTYYF
jgi:hypothetical protein